MMDLTIQTSTNEFLTLQPANGSVLSSLQFPGSSAWKAEGDLGTIIVEEFRSGSYTIRFTFFHLLKKMTLYISSATPAICTRIITKNNWRFGIGSERSVNLQEGQFAMYRAGNGREKISFEKGKEYRSFDAFCAPEKLSGLLSLFPKLNGFLDMNGKAKPAFLVNRVNWVAPEAMDIVRDIPDCPYDSNIRSLYVDNRLEQLFLVLVGLASKETPEHQELSGSEIDAAHAARTMILTDIKLHYTIPNISRKVHLNEFRLKYVFKKIYGSGIFEFLLHARMQEAKKLLIVTNKPIKEIAGLTGYVRLTSFITAFRKFFGYTPGAVRRAKKATQVQDR